MLHIIYVSLSFLFFRGCCLFFDVESTWIGFQISIISDSIENISGITESAYLLFINSIAYSFYPFLALFLVGLVVFTGKDFGPMVDAEKKARKNKQIKNTKQKSKKITYPFLLEQVVYI